MIEASVVVALIFGGMIGFGIGHGKPESVPESRPISWPSKEHQEGMLMCRTMCDKQVRKYETITGECECKEK